MNGSDPEFSVSEFIAAFNQTVEYAFGSVVIHGELANFRVSRNQWVYFDLKDEASKVEFFGSVYALPGPLEEGMILKVRGVPRLHERYGFNVVFNSISPTGTGSIKRANELLAAKLDAEGLFALERKRSLPYPPNKVGLITSYQSAAYADFERIINNRWSGVSVDCLDVNVQGDQAPGDIIRAIEFFSSLSVPPDVLVVIRGGGSPEDLAAFNNEQVIRAVAASRVPTLVAIGHESDISLAELAADARASTPSNAAELLVPDKKAVILQLHKLPEQLSASVVRKMVQISSSLDTSRIKMAEIIKNRLDRELVSLDTRIGLINALSPKDILKRGFAIVRSDNKVSNGYGLKSGSIVTVELYRSSFEATITKKLKDLHNAK